jgi:hypothetical protein
MATEYKKVALVDVKDRNTQSLSSAEQTRVNTVVNKFFELFAAKHT